MRQQAIGRETAPVTTEIEKGAIIKFARAIGDENPLFNDEAGARKGPYGGLIAPPTFLRSVASSRMDLPFEIPFERVLDGGSEWEYFEPVRPGDRITVTSQFSDIYERPGRLGNMLFMVRETSYVNQAGRLVAVQRTTGISYDPPEG